MTPEREQEIRAALVAGEWGRAGKDFVTIRDLLATLAAARERERRLEALLGYREANPPADPALAIEKMLKKMDAEDHATFNWLVRLSRLDRAREGV